MIQQFHELERIVRNAPLGIRFIDALCNHTVTDRLDVRIWEIHLGDKPYQLGRAIRAHHSSVSGVYGFRTLPGLRTFEFEEDSKQALKKAKKYCPEPNGDDDHRPNYLLYVCDTAERYLPIAIKLCVPKTSLVQIKLYSSPARLAPAGYSPVYGHVCQKRNAKPADWALIEATNDQGKMFQVLANEDGLFTLYVAHPSLPPHQRDHPPFNQVETLFTFRVGYGADKTKVKIDGQALPEYNLILSQPRVKIYEALDSIPQLDVEESLLYMSEYILKTTGDDKGRLLVE